MRAREADARDPVDRVTGAQQLTEVRPDPGEVASPRVDVLAEEGDLPDTLPRESSHLGDHVARAAAHLAASHGRDDAVRALRVAPHRDLHPGLEGPLAMHGQL